MRFALPALILSLFLCSGSALGGLSRAQLNGVSAIPPAGARLDPGLRARDTAGRLRSIGSVLAGRTGFVTFVDYTCNTLCGTDLELLSEAIQKGHLRTSEYRILVMGIDPRDSPRAAVAMERKEIPRALWPNTVLLLPASSVVRTATQALGFRFVYDAAIDQFAHPAAIYVVAPDGQLQALLSPLTLTPETVRAALDARPASRFFATLVHLCYGYDPVTGIYTLRVERVLRIAAAATLLLLTAALFFLIRVRRSAA